MTTYPFDVHFKIGPSIRVHAFNIEEARILAQAERIKGGYDYRCVTYVRKITG